MKKQAEIQVLRLSTGEDIIAFVEYPNTKEYVIINPVTFFDDFEDTDSGQKTTTMKFWLPMNEIEMNFVTIDKSKVMFITNPDDDFCDKYNAILSHFYENSENESFDDSHERNQLLLEEKQNKVLH